jgi:hypothetical protein
MLVLSEPSRVRVLLRRDRLGADAYGPVVPLADLQSVDEFLASLSWSGSMYGEEPVMDEFAVAQIEVVSDAWGRPRLVLHGEVAKRLECLVADVSLSHDGDYAMAYVVLSAASR